MTQNIYSLQLLRNGTPFSSYTAAVNAITGDTTRQDGIIKLARYTSSTETSGTAKYNTDTVKTVFGIYYKPASGDGSWTLFDSYHEVIQNIQNQIDSLTGGAGSIAEQIRAALDQLDFSGVTGNVVTQVTQENGKVAATGANVGNLVLTDYIEGSESGHVEASDSINAAFAKLQNQIDAANDAKNAAIEALDAVITAENGSYIDHIEQVDGKISGTTKVLPSLSEVHEAGKPIIAVSENKGQLAASAGTINAEFVDVADAGNVFTATTVEGVLSEIDAAYKAADAALKTEILGGASASADTLGELEQIINNIVEDSKSYSIVTADTTSLDANVRDAYKLVDEDGTQVGETIKIYKDQTLKQAEYSGQSLVLTYILEDGSETAVTIDMHDLIEETEFGSGVTWDATASKVRGVVDPTSETFLTVGANGFKLAGVRAAIDAASGDVKSKLDELSGKTEALSAKTVTSIASADGSVTATPGQAAGGTVSYDLSTDASKVKVSSAYTAGINTAIATGDTVDAALAKLEAQVAAAKAAATTKVAKDAAASHLTIASATSDDGSVTYTIGESDIASKSDLDAEIAARKAVDGQNGQTYAANTSANYISGAISLNDADVKLDTALKAVEDAAGNVQTEIDAIENAVGLNADGTHVQSTGNYTSSANSIEGEIVALDGQVKTNTDNIAALSGKSVTSVTVNGVEVVSNNVAPIVLGYTNEAANSENGMVITTNQSTGAMDIKFGTLDCGEYN